MEEDLDTYEHDNPEVGTPTHRAMAKRLGVTIAYVQHFLNVFEEEFDRIETLQYERKKEARNANPSS